jgi:glycerol kinase
VADVIEAVRERVPVDRLRVDGGLTREPLLLELQADASGAVVEAGTADATVAGAAALAAVGAGVLGTLDGVQELLPVTRRVDPRLPDEARIEAHARWKTFVDAAARL